MKPDITACIICNDDYKIFDCIKSISSSCNEIIVGFNGHDNKLRSRIRHLHKVWLIDYNWHNNFAAARNFVIRRASGEWIFIIDADEILQNPITKLSDEIDFYFAKQITNQTQINHIRLFRNGKNIEYKNKIHEAVDESVTGLRGAISDIVILHNSQYDETKLQRNYNILQKDKSSPVYNFYMMLYHFNSQNYCDAIKHGQLALSDPLNDDLKAITCNIIAESYCMIRNKDVAKLYIAMSLRLVPTQIFARIKILDFLDGTKKSIMLAIKQLDRLIESQQTDLTYDLKLSKTFLQNKKTELQKWQSQ